MSSQSAIPSEPELLPRRRQNRRHGRLWHVANVLGGLAAVGAIIAVTQMHSTSSGVQVTVAGAGASAPPPAQTLLQVRQRGSREVVAGHVVPPDGRVTFHLSAGDYTLVVRAPGRRHPVFEAVQIKGGQFASVTLRVPPLRAAAHRSSRS